MWCSGELERANGSVTGSSWTGGDIGFVVDGLVSWGEFSWWNGPVTTLWKNLLIKLISRIF